MAVTVSLDDFARDVAMEIQLGGDRFDPSDVAERLEGIPEADLKTFRERVFYHSMDFYPFPDAVVGSMPGKDFLEIPWVVANSGDIGLFTDQMCDAWLGGVKTAEQLGRKPSRSVFEAQPLHWDRGKYFMLRDGNIRRCDKATRTAAFGRNADALCVMEISRDDAVRGVCSQILSRFGTDTPEGRTAEFISAASVPEGLVYGVMQKSDGAEPELVLGGLRRLPLQKCSNYASQAFMDMLSHELDEQCCLEFNRAASERSAREVFRRKADILMDSFGEATAADRLYYGVEIWSDGGRGCGRCSVLRREIDELKPKESLRYYFLDGERRVPEDVSEYDTASLDRLIGLVDSEMEYRMSMDALSEGIVLEDGPEVVMPRAMGMHSTMVVGSVFTYGGSDELWVSGIPGGHKSRVGGREVQFRLDELSDSGVNAVRQATDRKMKEVLSNVRREMVEQSRVKDAAKRRGVTV